MHLSKSLKPQASFVLKPTRTVSTALLQDEQEAKNKEHFNTSVASCASDVTVGCDRAHTCPHPDTTRWLILKQTLSFNPQSLILKFILKLVNVWTMSLKQLAHAKPLMRLTCVTFVRLKQHNVWISGLSQCGFSEYCVLYVEFYQLVFSVLCSKGSAGSRLHSATAAVGR